MYWRFNEDDLKATEGMQSASIAPSISASGDYCHRDVIDSKDKGQRNFVLEFCKPPHLFFETNDNDDVLISQATYRDLNSVFL